jgi:bacillithiol biosynthesis deacetylase BshB1
VQPLEVLAFSAHPDDAEIGCGGALALAARRGLRVGVVDLTDGERATRGTPASRATEREEATRTLGLSERIALGLPDGELEVSRQAVAPVVEVIRESRPRIVLAPNEVDRHPDHEAAGRLVRQGCFEAGLESVGSGALHRPAHQFSYMVHSPFDPSFVVDISAVWERKRAAVVCYRSQFSPDGGGRPTALSGGGFLGLLELRARWFGAMIGVRHGEPYLCRGPVPLSGLPGGRARNASDAPSLEYSMW